MANKFNEPEEMQDDVYNIDYDPLGQPINEKPYTRPNVTVDPKDLVGDIPEPSFQPPPIDLGSPQFEETAPKREAKPFNPEMNDLPKKEKEMAASHVAKMIMQGYEFMHTIANKGMTFSDKKLNKLAREGEVDFSIQIPYDYKSNQTMSAGEFINEFNEQQKDTLVVSQEFKEEVTPVLERVLKKRGVGMTDEQYLIFLFGKDIAIKTTQFMATRSQMGEIINQLKEMTAEMKNSGSRGYSAPPPPPPPSSSPSPTNNYYEVVPDDMDYSPNPVVLDTSDPEEESQDDFYENLQDDEQIIGSVAEQVEAQLQNKTVAQLRREEAQRARDNFVAKPKGKRGRKKKGE
jgi:hypothetical protein